MDINNTLQQINTEWLSKVIEFSSVLSKCHFDMVQLLNKHHLFNSFQLKIDGLIVTVDIWTDGSVTVYTDLNPRANQRLSDPSPFQLTLPYTIDEAWTADTLIARLLSKELKQAIIEYNKHIALEKTNHGSISNNSLQITVASTLESKLKLKKKGKKNVGTRTRKTKNSN